MKIIFVFAICTFAWAQNGVDRPRLGKMLDANGSVRSVYGISASVTLGDEETTGVISSACSKTFCLAKTETSIVSTAGTIDAPTGPAMFGFDGDAAFVWLPRARQLARWHDGVLDFVDASVDGDVLSIRATTGVVEFAVRRHSGVWIVKQDGSVVDSLPRSSGPVMLIPGGAVYASHGELVIRDARLPIEKVTSFSQMSDNYLQVRAGGLNYSLRIEKGNEKLFQLPGVQQ